MLRAKACSGKCNDGGTRVFIMIDTWLLKFGGKADVDTFMKELFVVVYLPDCR